MRPANLSPNYLLSQAWANFTARPGLCVAAWIIFAVLGGNCSGGGASRGSGDGALDELGGIGALILAALVVGGLLIAVVGLVIAGPIRGGYELAMLRLIRGESDVQIGDIFAGFSKFLPLMLTFLLLALTVGIGLILCVVPGLIALIALWPAFLLVQEDDLGPVEAIRAAWALTDGHKISLAVLALVNSVLVLLGALACCVGLLVTGPVAQLAWIGAYNEMRMAAGTRTEVEPAPELPAPEL